MLSKKKKVFVLVGMVALLVVTGYLNIVLNGMGKDKDVSGDALQRNFFASFRADRVTTRNESLLIFDAIINNTATTAEAKATAEKSKEALTRNMELELVLEGLIKALGFEDAVVTNTTENINVMIKSPELKAQQVAQVLEIITSETNREAINVRVIPVE